MKTFKIKDLMVSLDDKRDQVNAPAFCPGFSYCGFNSFGCHFQFSHCFNGCTHPSFCFWGCTFAGSGCGHLTIYCNPTYIDIRKLPEGPEFKEMKDQMTLMQKAMDAQLGPQSIEDISELETKLNEALAELKNQKANLKKG